MRDGMKLHTVIISPRGLRDLPILLERTPLDANKNTSGNSRACAMRYGRAIPTGRIPISRNTREGMLRSIGFHGVSGRRVAIRACRQILAR